MAKNDRNLTGLINAAGGRNGVLLIINQREKHKSTQKGGDKE